MIFIDGQFLGQVRQADLHGAVAAGGEGAARGHAGQVHRRTRNGNQPLVAAVQLGDGPQQTLGVFMLRIVEDLIHGAALADAARVHHDDLVAHVGDDAQVVRNHDDGHAQLLLQVLHQ